MGFISRAELVDLARIESAKKAQEAMNRDLAELARLKAKYPEPKVNA